MPDFGGEEENVLRRVIVYETASLPATNLAAEKWMYDNAMHCIAWMAEEINSNLELVDVNERWYEDPASSAITNFPSRKSCQHIAAVSRQELHQTPFNAIGHVSPPAIHSKFHRVAESVRGKRPTRLLQSSSHSDDSSIDQIQSDVALNLPVHQKVPQRHCKRMMPGQTKVVIRARIRCDHPDQIPSSTLLKWTMRIKRHQHIHMKIVAASLKSMCAAKILFANLSAREKKPTTKRTGMM